MHLAQARLARHPELGLVVFPNMSATGERASNPRARLQARALCSLPKSGCLCVVGTLPEVAQAKEVAPSLHAHGI